MSFHHVKIYHGPCECKYLHTYTYKPQKLYALRKCLQVLGYRVDLVPIDLMDFCIIEICGFEVFRCNMSNLCFNMDARGDQLCQHAVAAVKFGCERMQRAHNFLWIRDLVCRSAFKSHAPKTYFNNANDIEPFSSPCAANCCNILLAGNPDAKKKADTSYK